MPKGIYKTQKKRGRPKKEIADIQPTASIAPTNETNGVKILLQLGASTFESAGSTVFEALSNFPLDFTQVQTNGTFRIFRGNTMYERFMRLFEIRKILRNPVNRKWWTQIFEENLDILQKKHDGK